MATKQGEEGESEDGDEDEEDEEDEKKEVKGFAGIETLLLWSMTGIFLFNGREIEFCECYCLAINNTNNKTQLKFCLMNYQPQ